MVKRPTRRPDRYNAAAHTTVEERGPVTLHKVGDELAAIVTLSGRAFCAVAADPRPTTRGWLIAFAEDL